MEARYKENTAGVPDKSVGIKWGEYHQPASAIHPKGLLQDVDKRAKPTRQAQATGWTRWIGWGEHQCYPKREALNEDKKGSPALPPGITEKE